MKTIEELGKIAQDTWADHGFRMYGTVAEREAFIKVAKAIVTAIADDAVSWAPGDDE